VISKQMQITERYALLVGSSALLAAWGVLLGRPLALVGSAGIGAWLLTAQYRFVRQVRRSSTRLTVTQTLDRPRVVADETTLCTLSVSTASPTSIPVAVEAAPPISGDSAGGRCALEVGAERTQATFEITWPVAGQYAFEAPTITYTDRRDLFRHEIEAGTTPTVTVEPRAPRDIHIGEGGDRIAPGFGEHDTGRTGSGLKPAELRRYLPGDTAQQIDWKATARLAEPYVREFESQTDLETVLLVDHRHAMGDGPDGETKLAFARQVALAIVASAQELGDPLGCYTVGDDGLTHTFAPSTAASQYQTVTQRIQALTPTGAASEQPDGVADPARARRLASRLSPGTAFGERLQPFLAAADPDVERIGERPLFRAAQLATARSGGSTRTIIVTDDTDRTALVEAVKLAQRGGGSVFVYLTPSALFTEASVRDLDDAYRRYTEFESFRRDLTALQRVSAFEVGPRDQLARVLSAGDRARQRRAEP
jgi:uncharacterized protein (DUF58 family)